MMNFIQSFIKSEKIQKIQSDYNVNLKFPKSQILPISLLLDRYTFSNYLLKKKPKYPILVKFAGYQLQFEHKMSIILSDDGFVNFSEFLKTLNLKGFLKL